VAKLGGLRNDYRGHCATAYTLLFTDCMPDKSLAWPQICEGFVSMAPDPQNKSFVSRWTIGGMQSNNTFAWSHCESFVNIAPETPFPNLPYDLPNRERIMNLCTYSWVHDPYLQDVQCISPRQQFVNGCKQPYVHSKCVVHDAASAWAPGAKRLVHV
jgi:hypothetical protein